MNPYLGLGLALGAFVLAGGFLYRRKRARLEDCAQVAQALAGGNLRARAQTAERGEYQALALSLNQAAEALERRISGLEENRMLLESALVGMSEGLLVVDRQQKILLANPSSAHLLGFTEREAVGKPFWEVFREEQALGSIREVLENGQPLAVQIGPLGDRHLTLSISPTPARDRLVIVVHDTTESARYQELRKEFVANVSHELRTPLTLIRGFVETLQDGALQDPVRGPEFLSIISKHSSQLTNLVENLLDLSRLESPQALRKQVRVDMKGILSRVTELQMPGARKKNQKLALSVPAHLPLILGDPDYLERAVSNLVDNAIKYTPEGGTIQVSATWNGTNLSVQVEDNGIGIPEKDLPRIFERFYRVDKSRSRDMGGTGLGLAIVKHVVQSHGGTVDVTSKPGKGSSFRLSFPLES
jgi:two-component system phosphate regulon sensor histidine kinase PhoR